MEREELESAITGSLLSFSEEFAKELRDSLVSSSALAHETDLYNISDMMWYLSDTIQRQNVGEKIENGCSTIAAAINNLAEAVRSSATNG